LNEEPPYEEEPFQIHKRSKPNLLEMRFSGGQQEGISSGKISHDFISASDMSTRIKFDIYTVVLTAL
jgi:hypothetical protein